MKLTNEEIEKLDNIEESENYQEYYHLFKGDHEFFISVRNIVDSEAKLKVRWGAVSSLAYLIFSESSGHIFGEKPNFFPTIAQKSFQKFMYSWDRLRRKNIPFELWSDLTEEGLLLLKALINEKKIETYPSDKRYESLMRKFVKRHEDLRMSGKYPDLNELMDD